MRGWCKAAGALLAGGVLAAQAPAPSRPACEVPAFRNGPQGGYTDATMRVAPGAAGCRMRLWADVEARRPYDSIEVIRPAERGVVTVIPEGVTYRPNSGNAGPDIFELRASGTGRSGQPVRSLFRVSVTVLPPS